MFGCLSSEKELEDLNCFLADRSYISGYEATTLDSDMSKMLRSLSALSTYPHVARWQKHIASYTSEFLVIPKEPLSKYVHTTPCEVRLVRLSLLCCLAVSLNFLMSVDICHVDFVSDAGKTEQAEERQRW